MPIPLYKNLAEGDLDRTVWRYLTFPKYISLLSYRALWFSKLNVFRDQREGFMPTVADAEMLAEHQQFERHFAPELHGQIDNANKTNVDDGRELTVASCWFLGGDESETMWNEYASGGESVAIKSTVRALSQHVFCDPQWSHVGKVQYVDLNTHSMTHYEANQAHHRAFLKGLDFSHESEVRIVTMSFKGPMCVNMDGTVMRSEDYQGAKMNNFENSGLFIQADLSKLIQTTILTPGASTWFELLVKRLVQLARIDCPVERSKIEK